MDNLKTIAALDALAQEKRLDIYRLLLAETPNGLMVGDIAKKMEMAPTTLSFHLDKLRHADLIYAERDGRATIYRASLETLTNAVSFLTETCCASQGAKCQITIQRNCNKGA